MEDFVELGRRHAHNGGLFIDHTLLEHIHRHLESGDTGTLADTALQHPELALLDGEFYILHIVEVLLEMFADFVEILVNLWHSHLKRLEILVMLGLGSLVERVRGPDTGNHILALGIDEPLAIELVVTAGRVA